MIPLFGHGILRIVILFYQAINFLQPNMLTPDMVELWSEEFIPR